MVSLAQPSCGDPAVDGQFIVACGSPASSNSPKPPRPPRNPNRQQKIYLPVMPSSSSPVFVTTPLVEEPEGITTDDSAPEDKPSS